MKVVFGKPGPFGWKQAVQLTIEHPAHKTFFTRKLWGYFIPEPADDETQAGLEELYVTSGHSIQAGAERDPQAPAALRGPADGEAAGRLPRRHAAPPRRPHLDRGLGLALDPGRPAPLLPARTSRGWNDDRWLDTSTFQARWNMAGRVLKKHAYIPTTRAGAPSRPIPAKLVDRAVSFWGVAARQATRRRARLLRPQGDGRRRRRRRPPEEVPADDAERAPPPRRRLAGDADLVSPAAPLRRVLARDPAAARGRRGRATACRRSSRACPLPRAPGSTAARSSRARSAPR